LFSCCRWPPSLLECLCLMYRPLRFVLVSALLPAFVAALPLCSGALSLYNSSQAPAALAHTTTHTYIYFGVLLCMLFAFCLMLRSAPSLFASLSVSYGFALPTLFRPSPFHTSSCPRWQPVCYCTYICM